MGTSLPSLSSPRGPRVDGATKASRSAMTAGWATRRRMQISRSTRRAASWEESTSATFFKATVSPVSLDRASTTVEKEPEPSSLMMSYRSPT
jgi:hypothetical protein